MRFNQLTMTNFKSYYGTHYFNLTTDKLCQNVILFGGLNGAGKTTILEAIRLALYGSLAYGFKTENNTYLDNIKTKLNTKAVARKERRYQIHLEFEYVENLIKNTYIFIRTWYLERGRIREEFQIFKNGQYLSELDKDLFKCKLHGEIPPQLFEFCLFDGEEIARIINNDLLHSYLKDITKVMFNLDLFDNLENDLSQYLKNNKNLDLSVEEKVLQEKSESLCLLRNKQDELYTEVRLLEDNLDNQLIKKSELKKEFNIYGGLAKDEREQMLIKLNDLEHKRLRNSEETKEFVSTLLPFFLVKELIATVKTRLEKEQEYEMYDTLKQKFSDVDAKKLVLILGESNLIKEEALTKASCLLHSSILKMFEPESANLIHRASFVQRSTLESTLDKLNEVNPKNYINNFIENQEILKEIHSIRKKIDNYDSTSDFKDLLENIDKLTRESEKLKIEMELKKEQLSEITKEIEQLEKELENERCKLLHKQKTENTFVFSCKVIEVSKHFRQMQLKKKLQEVQFLVLKMLNMLLRTNQYISDITISPDTFDILLFNSKRQVIDKKTLSAGEKQVLLLALIWGIMKASGRRLPLVLDTLLGRLDSGHKENVLRELIPKFGDQVIILATDSEIDAKHYKYIQKHIAKCYTIDNKKLENKIVSSNGMFFDFGELGVG